jgi:4-amino-4-deoxy-L-arabinose transferase-like glycosyltransferase
LAGLILLLSVGVLGSVARLRGAEYDEGYTIFIADGVPRPHWPDAPFRAGEVRGFFAGQSTPARIAADLRSTDVHPPLYFWAAAAWRHAVGPGLFQLRLLSVAFGLAALMLVGAMARIVGAPPPTAMLFTLGCYAFSYTAAFARGIVLAQALSLGGVLLLLIAARRPRGGVAPLGRALGGGLLLGLATFSNYLAVFVAVAALLWLLLARWSRPTLWLAAGLSFAAMLPADLFFFLAQRDSRVGQYPPFHLLAMLERLAQYAVGAVFGGLPLYLPGLAGEALGGALALLLAALVVLIVARWRRVGAASGRWLLAMATVAPPVGLVLLGLAFNNMPLQLRYLAFAVPFFALLLAGALAALPPRAGMAVAAVVLALQAASLAGLAAMPQTMQPQAAVTRAAAALAGPDGLVLVPLGNDGVGVVGAVVQSAPDWLRLLVVPRHISPETLRHEAASAPVVVLALLGLDGDSRATLPTLRSAFADQPCWRPTQSDSATAAFAREPACAPSAAR